MPEDTETAAVLAEGQPPAHSMKEADFIALMMKLKPGSERSDHVKSKTACVAAFVRICAHLCCTKRARAPT